MERNDSPQSSTSFLKKLWTRVATGTTDIINTTINAMGKILSLKNVILVAIGGSLLHLFNIISIPFVPFTTQGRIYVDSPEVYTRERLVNDRYDQDYWLRTQLNQLDEQKIQLISRLSRTEISAAIKTTENEQTNQEAVRPANSNRQDGLKQLTFKQEFHIIAGIRDMIRQQILENMLDDRHDLTGNSVYGLKFDTTVIPGSNTRQRAFVHVKVKVADTFNTRNKESPAVENHIKGYILDQLPPGKEQYKDLKASFCEGKKECEEVLIAKYRKQEELYLKWIKNIEKRLNLTENSVTEHLRNQGQLNADTFREQVIVDTLNTVLGIPHELLLILNRQQSFNEEGGQNTTLNTERPSTPTYFMDWVKLPPPWSRFFKISQLTTASCGTSTSDCKDYMWFGVHELYEQFHVFKDSENEVQDDLIPVSVVENGAWTLYLNDNRLGTRESFFGVLESATPQYTLSSGAVEILQTFHGDEIEIRSGFFNFVEKLSLVDAYSYAMFPKNEMVGVLDEISMNLKALVPGSGLLGVGQQQSTSKTASALVGYGDGSKSGPYREKDDDAIAFGWVITPHGTMEAIQKNQLALVSVPAWTDTLNMTVSMGWLDGESKPTGKPDQFSRDISVPPDYEAFDTIFREDSWVTHEPRIQKNTMDKEIYVRSGSAEELNETVKLLIPGTRLWRSTSVTLGGQQADRIRVLPNMKGIIAEFNSIDLPYSGFDKTESGRSCPEKKGLLSRPVKLRIWTSEGATSADEPVCVYYDPKRLGILE